MFYVNMYMNIICPFRISISGYGTQALINNGFPNYIIDTEIKHFINKTEQHNIDNILNHK